MAATIVLRAEGMRAARTQVSPSAEVGARTTDQQPALPRARPSVAWREWPRSAERRSTTFVLPAARRYRSGYTLTPASSGYWTVMSIAHTPIVSSQRDAGWYAGMM